MGERDALNLSLIIERFNSVCDLQTAETVLRVAEGIIAEEAGRLWESDNESNNALAKDLTCASRAMETLIAVMFSAQSDLATDTAGAE